MFSLGNKFQLDFKKYGEVQETSCNLDFEASDLQTVIQNVNQHGKILSAI